MKSIMVVGPSLNSIGGISTFVRGMLGSELKESFKFIYFDTFSYKKSRSHTSVFNFSGIFGLIRVLYFYVLRIVSERPDSVVLNTSSYWGFWEKSCLLFISKMLGRKTVLIVHGANFKEFYLASRLKRFILLILHAADKTVFVSSSMHAFFVKESAAGKHGMCCIPNPVDNPLEEGSSTESLEAVSSVSEELSFVVKHKYNTVFLSLSLLEPRKRILQVLSAYEAITATEYGGNCCLIVAGEGVIEKEIKEKCDEIESVYFVGPVRGKYKKELFGIANCFIQFSERESFGLTMIEAILAGNYLISSDVGVLEGEELGEGVAKVLNEVDLFSAISYYLMNSETLKVGKAALEFAQSKSWKERYVDYATILHSL